MSVQVDFSHVAQSDQCPLYNEIFSRLYLANETSNSKTSRCLRPFQRRVLTRWPGPSIRAAADQLDYARTATPPNHHDHEEKACRAEETSAAETVGERGMCYAAKMYGDGTIENVNERQHTPESNEEGFVSRSGTEETANNYDYDWSPTTAALALVSIMKRS